MFWALNTERMSFALLLLVSLLSFSSCSPMSEELDYSNDAGVYDYDYTHTEDDKSEEKVIELSVANVVIHSSKLNIVVEEDQLIRLPCLMDNPDDISIIWSHIGASGRKAQIAIGEKMLSTGRRTVKADRTGSTLLILAAEKDDSGEYICEVATGSESVPSLVHTVTVRARGEGEMNTDKVVVRPTERSSAGGSQSKYTGSCVLSILLVLVVVGLVG